MKIYLACPYSDPDPEVLEARFQAACRAAAGLISAGHVVFSPISHSHPIACHMGNHLDHSVWLAQDREFLHWCDSVFVLAVDGWERSRGVSWEIDFARKLGKPVFFIGGGP